MLMSFDIDCGELISGHRFIVRGLADCGTLEFDGETAAGISLEYELVPGVASGTGKRVFDYLVGIEYEADVELPWMAVDGGAIAPFAGGATTHGSRGDWPLPIGARVLKFRVTGVDEVTGFQHQEYDGVLTVDLQGRSVQWLPRLQ